MIVVLNETKDLPFRESVECRSFASLRRTADYTLTGRSKKRAIPVKIAWNGAFQFPLPSYTFVIPTWVASRGAKRTVFRWVMAQTEFDPESSICNRNPDPAASKEPASNVKWITGH